MIELPVLIENIIEIVNVAIEMMLVFLYFSLLSKAKVNKAVLYLSYLLSTVILSATVLLTDNILVYLITTIILISSMSFICYDDSIRHKIFWNILFLLIISISEPIVIGLLCIANMGTPDEFLRVWFRTLSRNGRHKYNLFMAYRIDAPHNKQKNS